MTYVEGASLHPERGGATVFARYAFNELVELRRRLGDPARLRDPASRSASFSATHYLAAFWADARATGAPELAIAGAGDRRLRRGAQHPRPVRDALQPRAARSSSSTSCLQLLLIVRRRWRCSSTSTARSTRSTSASTPTGPTLLFALGVATVALTGLEAASGLAGEVRGRRARGSSG